MGCLKVFRWILSAFLILILTVTILAGIPLTTLSVTVTNRESVKNILKNSGIYDNVVEIALTAAENSNKTDQPNNQNSQQPSIPFTQDMADSISEYFTPEYTEQTANTVIDGVYDWLEGKTEKPEFQIQLAQDEEKFKSTMVDLIDQHMSSLPVCDPNYQPPEGMSPFEAECRPANYSITDLENQINQQQDSEELNQMLDKTTIDSSDLEIDPKLSKNVQKVYKLLNFLPVLVLGIILILVLLIVLLVPTFKTGLIVGGTSTAVPSILLLISSFFGNSKESLNKAVELISQNAPAEMKSTVQVVSRSLLESATTVFSKDIALYSFAGLALGASLLIGGILLKKKKSSETE